MLCSGYRCPTFGNLTKPFTRIYGDAVGPEEWRFLAEPGAAGLLRTLPETARSQAA